MQNQVSVSVERSQVCYGSLALVKKVSPRLAALKFKNSASDISILGGCALVNKTIFIRKFSRY